MLSRSIFAFFLLAVVTAAGCGGGEVTDTTSANGSPSATPASSPSEGNSSTTSNSPETDKEVEAVTLKPVVDTFCKAMRNKDEAGLRSVYSRATLRSFEADMKADGVATLAEFLSSEPVGEKCGVANERIQGDVGEALITTQTYPNGIMIKFVKEGGEWKMTNQSSDFDSVRKGGN